MLVSSESQGVSTEYFKHSSTHPLHGCGQGTGWSTEIWKCNLDVTIISLQKYLGLEIISPEHKIRIEYNSQVVVDNTFLSTNQMSNPNTHVINTLKTLSQKA